MKKLIVFDLDGTLAESKAAIDKEMAERLAALLTVAKVAVMSGGDWPQFEKQVLGHLPKGAKLRNLSILPTCGTKYYQYKRGWKQLYAENFTDDQKHKIIDSINKSVDASGYRVKKTWGEAIEDRGSQITYSALGQSAPLDEKKKYDPDFKKRKKIKAHLDKLIPEFDVNLGGSTSIDVTKKGIDKEYGMHKLHQVLDIKISEMIFIGDAIFPGGNDYPAKQSGAYAVCVKDSNEAKRVIEGIIGCLDKGKFKDGF
ncbi:HAD-IIB family hydrolase [Mucilaginibacter sp. L3T2-6]|uniref:HAD-IIB family hydrolase n=1 Tax=Mucilaginibacter sp. L3T2-6 TaxID=3062491 RepID=UPI0026745551|nr:HAD-IIB family hydrolase [Mucilaginibacter sp. L3T2-6]MDO3642163.1 HAD-IIB family hydrolase [Mucilaginibacter sp. L3T2-6]MDV6214658.1 HAD-IIB family hydrolase [Mucilaginibacter sp. L3T2-6]